MKPLPLLPSATPRAATLQVTIDIGNANALLRLLSAAPGTPVRPRHIEPLDHARRMRLSLCLDSAQAQRLIGAIVRRLPSAEIGRIGRIGHAGRAVDKCASSPSPASPALSPSSASRPDAGGRRAPLNGIRTTPLRPVTASTEAI